MCDAGNIGCTNESQVAAQVAVQCVIAMVSLPLGAILLGVSLGKAAIKMQKAETAIRTAAGVLLVGAGFYLLATF